MEVAWAVSHTQGNYLAAQYRRQARRLGAKKAALAIAHRVLRIIYYLLREGTTYTDLGADYCEPGDKAKIERHHIQRLEQLGYTVTLRPPQAA